MKTLIIITTITLAACLLFKRAEAQLLPLNTADTSTFKRAHNLYAELLGPGILLSVNYDLRFSNNRNGLGGRFGLGYASDDNSSLFTIPVQLNYLIGDKSNFFELGIGATYISFDDIENRSGSFFGFDDFKTVLGTTTIGYRYQPVKGGINFRGSWNPVFNSSGLYPAFFGLSLGYSF